MELKFSGFGGQGIIRMGMITGKAASIYDDRNASPGVQFADADLLGVPIRIVVSPRNLEKNRFEFKRRDTGERGEIDMDGAVDTIRNWIKEGLRELAAGPSARKEEEG